MESFKGRREQKQSSEEKNNSLQDGLLAALIEKYSNPLPQKESLGFFCRGLSAKKL
ncbi:MAG: hypothetical protein ABIQ35_03895 [Verrucomicrobiota bacterium]